MLLRIALGLSLITNAVAADRKPITAQAGNSRVTVHAVAYTDKEEIKRVVGSELGSSIVVVEITVTPKGGDPMKIFGDDFLLRSYKDGQKSGPFAPSQLAGKGGLALTLVNDGGGGVMANPSGPSWGGLGGGQPRRMGDGGGGIGNSASVSTTEATVKDDSKEKDNPLLLTLKQKGLPEKETAEPVKGLLYFPLEGKHKAKDLALQYTGAAGKLTLEFHQ